MADYKEIKGFKVQSLSADPVVGVAGWTAGGNYPSSEPGSAGAGTLTAALGTAPPGYSANSYEYDGTSWTAGGSMSQPRGQAQSNMTGTQTAALIVGGRYTPAPTFGLVKTEEYNGSSWTNGGDYPEQLRNANNMGTQTAAVNAGGNSANPSVATNSTNHYNGSSWTSASNNSTARFDTALFGLQTAGVMAGGFSKNPGSNVFFDDTEEYDGSSWTSGGNLPTENNAGAASGTLTAGIMFGGSQPATPGVVGTTIAYNGTSWTSLPATLSSARSGHGSARSGTQTATLAWTGSTPPATNSTEEYVDNSPFAGATVLNIGQVFYNTTTKEFKYTGAGAGSWATGNNINTARQQGAGAGTFTAGIIFGGEDPSANTGATEEFNGTSYSTSPGSMSTARRFLGAAGTQTAALAIMGEAGSNTGASEEYDGSSWTAGGTNPTAVGGNAGAGLQTAAISFGGSGPGVLSFTYNGTAFSPAPSLATARYRLGGSGTQTAALAFGGQTPPGTAVTAATEEYDGSSWTSSGSLNTARQFIGYAGQAPQSAALAFGGGPNTTASSNATEEYDGSTWTSVANLPTAKRSVLGGGTLGNTFSAGGGTPSIVATTDEWTGEGAATIKTVTTS